MNEVGSSGFLTTRSLIERPPFALGTALIDPATRTVTGPAGTVQVEPRVMQVLVVLAEARGAVVLRDELFRRCWGNSHVGDDSLNRTIAEVRKVEREAGGGAFTVETIPRTGYRLIVNGEVTGSADAAVQQEAPQRGRRQLLLAGLATAGVGVAAGSWALLRDPNEPRVRELVSQSEQALRSGIPNGESQGVGFLEEALKLRPRDPELLGKLALARAIKAEFDDPRQITNTVNAAQAAARGALAINARQPDALSALAILPPYFGDWLSAEQRMKSVLQVDSGHIPTLDAYAFLRVAVGRAREGSRARVGFSPCDPLNVSMQYRLIYAHWILGDVGAADRTAERALQLWPRHDATWLAHFWVLNFTDRPERALAMVADPVTRPQLPPRFFESLGAVARARSSGRPVDAARAADLMVAQVNRSPTASIFAVLGLAGLGEIDRAFDVATAYLLQQGPLMAAVRWRPGQLSMNDQRRRKTHMLFVPSSAAMRSDPRFMPLMESIGLADYWQKSGTGPDVMPA